MISPTTNKVLLPARSGTLIYGAVSLIAVAAISIPFAQVVREPAQAWLALAIIAVCWLGAFVSVSDGAKICGLVFWAFLGTWLGIAPLYQMATQQVAWNDRALLQNSDNLAFAQTLMLVSAVCFLVGGLIARRSGSCAQQREAGVSRISTAPLSAASIFGVVLLPVAITASGGFANLFSSRADRGGALLDNGLSVSQGGGPLLALASSFPSAVAVAVAYVSITATRAVEAGRTVRDRRVDVLLFCSIGVLLLALYCNPLSNTRFVAGGALGAVVLSLLRPRSSVSGRWLLSTLFFLVLFAYPLSFAFRQNSSLADLRFSLDDWAGLDFDGFQQWVNTVEFVDKFGIQNGYHLVAGFLYFVPRSIWPDKPVPASISVAEARGYTFTNLSLPLPAEFYLDAGVIGMAILMLLLGFLIEKLDQKWLTEPLSRVGMLAPLVAMLQIGLVRGPIGSQGPIFLTTLLMTYLLLAFVVRADTSSPHNGKLTLTTEPPFARRLRDSRAGAD